jgi:hypothetical protein
VRIYISDDNGLSKTVIMKSTITLILMIMGSLMSFSELFTYCIAFVNDELQGSISSGSYNKTLSLSTNMN